MRYILFLCLFVFFVSCSKEEKPTVTKDKPQTEQNQSNTLPDDTTPADTNLTPEEQFSSSIMTDFLEGAEDEDLEGYLEDEVYKNQQGYTGAAVIGLTPSTWLLSLEKDNSTKNYIIQRYVDFKTNDFYYRMNETPLKISDVVAGTKLK
jgi:hypothetical protein